MKPIESFLGIVLVAIVLYYLFSGNSTSVINAIGTQSASLTKALMGRG